MLIFTGCKDAIKPAKLNKLNGYWKIDFITHKNETFYPKGATKLVDFYVIKDENNLNVARSMNVGVLLENSFASGGTTEEKLEATRMKKFYYEYFIERIGAANIQLVGSSIKSTATDASKNGLAYRIYSCGIYGEDGDKNKMIVSL